MDRIARFLAARCRWLALIAVLSAAFPLYHLKDARIDNSIEVWLGKSSVEYKQYREFLTKYGNDEFVAIAGTAEDPLSKDSLALQRNLADRLARIEGVDNVLGIAAVADLLRQAKPDWKTILRQNTFFRNLLLGSDGHTFGLIVWLKRMNEPALRRDTVERIESVADEANAGKTTLHLAGTPLLNVALDSGSRDAAKRFLPIAIVISLGFLTIALRSWRGVAAVVAAVAVTILWTLGIMVLLGKTLNMVTVVLPSLLFVLCLSGGIHIVCRFQSILLGSDELALALGDTLRETIRPVFLSNVTTAVGFGSLVISDMQPVVDFGVFAAIGMLLSLLFNFTVVPGVLSILHAKAAGDRSLRSHWTAAIGQIVIQRRRWVLLLAAVILFISAGLTTKAHVESNVLKFFPDNSKISRDYRFIGQHLTGFYTVELDATPETQNGSTLLKALDGLGARLANSPEVAKVIDYRNIATCLAEIARPAFVPAQIARDNPLKPMLQKYRRIQDGRISLRMSVLIRAMSSKDFYVLLDRIKEQAKQQIGQLSDYTITGVVPLLNAAQQSLINTQIRSFAVACTVILILIALFMKSIRAMLAAVLPNLVPIFFLFATMVVLNIPFDAATVMIASVAIGIAADDTIHFLSHFRTVRQQGKDVAEAVRSTFQNIGRAITFTSVVASAGFMILILAEFKPIQYFGLFGSVTMVTAWIGDVFILPACVASLRLWN
ncbi:MAG: MMPL family transporter [Sedimentisphaerales bacterium]